MPAPAAALLPLATLAAWYRAIGAVTMTGPHQLVVIDGVGVLSSAEIRAGMRAARGAYAEGDRYAAVCAMERVITHTDHALTSTSWAWAEKVLAHVENAA
ncbi:hypothetical protein [Pseudonocardia sp. T1-2H]|uniref:hypothetical protein n=1 Tax=Pseudonocardia sp. T1-2H TaxID=3128899 RepID=UPI0031010D10